MATPCREDSGVALTTLQAVEDDEIKRVSVYGRSQIPRVATGKTVISLRAIGRLHPKTVQVTRTVSRSSHPNIESIHCAAPGWSVDQLQGAQYGVLRMLTMSGGDAASSCVKCETFWSRKPFCNGRRVPELSDLPDGECRSARPRSTHGGDSGPVKFQENNDGDALCQEKRIVSASSGQLLNGQNTVPTNVGQQALVVAVHEHLQARWNHGH